MIINPYLELRVAKNDAGIQSITVHAPVKGDGLKITTVERAHDEALFDFLVMHAATRGALGVTGVADNTASRLGELGFLVPQSNVPAAIRFECDFLAEPSTLLPKRLGSRAPVVAGSSERLIVSSAYQWLPEGPTEAMRGRFHLGNPFRADRVWLGVERLGRTSFYSADPSARGVLEALRPGETAPVDLAPDMRRGLVRIGALVTAAAAAADASEASRALTGVSAALKERRWVAVDEIIPGDQIAAIRRYYRALIQEGFVRYEDPEWPHRYFASREPLTYFFQQQLTPAISRIVGEPVKPSFSFLASYRPGAELKPHRDREQCYYAMSVLLDHGQTDDVSNWPIYFKEPGAAEATPVRASLGDGVLYFGEEVVHYRYPLKEGYSTLWFLFWVPEAFSGSLD